VLINKKLKKLIKHWSEFGILPKIKHQKPQPNLC